jgi:hypothetical protein
MLQSGNKLSSNIQDLTEICIVEVKVFYVDHITNEMSIMGCNIMDCEPKLNGLKSFVDDLSDKGDLHILDVKYRCRKFTENDSPKTYGATIH